VQSFALGLLDMASRSGPGKKKLRIDTSALREKASDSLSEEKSLRVKIKEISCLNVKSTADNSSVEVFLVCRFGLRKVVEAASIVSSVQFLPKNVAIAKVAQILGSTTEEANNLINLLEKMEVNIGRDDVGSRVLTPPTSICLDCQQQLVAHHDPTEVRVFTLKGYVKGEKWSLRCNACQNTYSYNKYGSRNGWKLYPNERNLVESSDCCFLEREVFNWMTSLR